MRLDNEDRDYLDKHFEKVHTRITNNALKIAEIKQPCTDVEIVKDKVKGHLKGHEDKHKNNLTKTSLLAAFITVFLHFLRFIWERVSK